MGMFALCHCVLGVSRFFYRGSQLRVCLEFGLLNNSGIFKNLRALGCGLNTFLHLELAMNVWGQKQFVYEMSLTASHVEYLVPSWWHCFGRFWELKEVGIGRRK
jgi:hypothetical protein